MVLSSIDLYRWTEKDADKNQGEDPLSLERTLLPVFVFGDYGTG